MTSGPAASASPIGMRYRRILAQNVTRYRQARGLSMKDLAAITKLSPDWISMIEAARVNPTLEVIVSLAMALKHRPGELLQPSADDSP